MALLGSCILVDLKWRLRRSVAPLRCDRFVDVSFPTSTALGPLERISVPLTWRRAADLRGHGQVRLFGTGGGKVKQGALGDCWLIGAIACLAEFPGHVEMLFDPPSLSAEGRYLIHLYQPSSTWRRVEIDDLVPIMPPPFWAYSRRAVQVDVPCFSQPVQGEVWPLLLEKAFAKVAGSYAALEGGLPEMAFQALTGQKEQLRWLRMGGHWRMLRFDCPRWQGSKVAGAVHRHTRRVLDDEQLFLRLAYYEQANFLLAASIKGSGEVKRPDGLLTGHAYSVLEVQEVHSVRLVRLRNPWGKEEWNGDWSRGSSAWKDHPHIAQDIAVRGGVAVDRAKADGSFWMAFEDFARCFDSINVCPATMPVPKASRYAQHSHQRGSPVCGRCHQPVQSCWLLVRGHGGEVSSQTSVPGLGWVRLKDGDLCQLCLQATSSQRRAYWQQGGGGGGKETICGVNERELTRRVPGIDYFPFEAGAGCSLPCKRPVCGAGAACVEHNPSHLAKYDHPWMKPGPEVVLAKSKVPQT